MRLSNRKQVTNKNYEEWLRPWVKWLQETPDRQAMVVNDQLLKIYLDKCYLKGSYSSYHRVGKQIVNFVNRYLGNKVTMI